jgi:hypothetical protein
MAIWRKRLDFVRTRTMGSTSEDSCVQKSPRDEPGSQVYSCASSKEQAKITWSAARQMLMNSPQFTQRAGIVVITNSNEP